MEKRLPLALFLSLLVLFAWNVCHPRPPIEPDPTGAAGTTPSEAGAEPAVPAEPATAPDVAATEERELVLHAGTPGEPGCFRARFSNRGARLVELALGGWVQAIGQDGADPANWPRLLEPVTTESGTTGSLLLRTSRSTEELAPDDLDEVLWTMRPLVDGDGRENGVEFRYGPGTGVVFTKRVRLRPGTWHLDVEIGIENVAAGPGGPCNLILVPAGCVPAELGDKFYQEPRAIAVGLVDAEDQEYDVEWESSDSAREESGTLDVPLPLAIAGVHNKYFAFLLRSTDDTGSLVSASYRGVRDEERLAAAPNDPKDAWAYVTTDVNLALKLPDPGGENTYGYTVYAGPKDPDLLVEDHPGHLQVVESDLSGWTIFSTIGKFLLGVLRFFHRWVGNWGVAIILMTVCVRAVLFPLNRRSQTSMARYQVKMKRVQPKLDEIKKKYENNPQKLREAQARIMQEEGAFPPLGGCLPVFLQIPIFFGLFSALRTAFDLRQAPFCLWIDDLSRPDRLLEINLQLPLIGEVQYFNLLPILMVVLWVVQQMGMPKPADEQAARMQKMMMFMPVVMGVFLYSYAAGLSVYMITQSTLGIIEQRVIKKIWPIDDTEKEKKPGKGCGPFSGTLEKIAERQREEMKRIQEGKPRRRPGTTEKKPKNRRL